MQRTVLRDNQYCIVLNPVDADGQPRLGQREVRRGVCSFFLHPGEVIEGGTQQAQTLSELEGLVLRASCQFIDKSLASTYGHYDCFVVSFQLLIISVYN